MTRRGLQITLGVLWLLDAGLQFQPYMFGPKFASDVISPAGAGQASFVSTPIEHVVHVVGAHPALYNAAFACAQLAIGLGLLLRRLVVPALVASIVWSLTVWYLGEGLGGLTGHNPALLTGAPGAALLYAVLAAAAWPNGRERPASWLAFAWAGYWVGGALLQVWRGPRIGPDLAATVSELANGAPGWLSRIDFSLARTLQHLSPAADRRLDRHRSAHRAGRVRAATGTPGRRARRLPCQRRFLDHRTRVQPADQRTRHRPQHCAPRRHHRRRDLCRPSARPCLRDER